MRERLIEILDNAPIGYEKLGGRFFKHIIENIADYLLENGVIVPPVKIGDTVYYIGGMYHHLIKSARVVEFDINQTGIVELYVSAESGINFQDKINKFYLTKEEALKALKGGGER